MADTPPPPSADADTPPPGCHFYATIDDVPPSCHKYWHQRHAFFSRYDAGIWMTPDAWFGVTPEPVANAIAADLRPPTPQTTTLIDAFAGTGANAIAFALTQRWARVFAIEADAAALACARHNAALYGVAARIWFIHGDCFAVLARAGQLGGVLARREAVVFASPPWGGPGYRDHSVFDLQAMEPYGLARLWRGLGGERGQGLCLYLPRTADLRQVAALVPEGGTVAVRHYCMFGASKALCVFFGLEVP